MKQMIQITVLLLITFNISAQSNIVEAEYFLDTDNGFGMNSVLDITSPNIDIVETVMANIPASTTIGYHKLYIRTKDAIGNWSQTVRKNIEIFAPVIDNNIVMGEYFVDEDPSIGSANTFAISPQEENVEQAFTAQILANTPLGYHKLYGRVKDSYGNWSHTFRKNIEVYLNPVTNVIEIEYFFDDDLEFGNNSIVSIDVPEMDGAWSFDVPYPQGAYNFDDVLFVRVMDSNNNWSITTSLDEIADLSIGENLYNSITINPNPFNDVISINVSKPIVFQQISVYDIIGKKVYQSNTDLRTLDLEFLESGTYILSLLTDTEKATFKIIRQ